MSDFLAASFSVEDNEDSLRKMLYSDQNKVRNEDGAWNVGKTALAIARKRAGDNNQKGRFIFRKLRDIYSQDKQSQIAEREDRANDQYVRSRRGAESYMNSHLAGLTSSQGPEAAQWMRDVLSQQGITEEEIGSFGNTAQEVQQVFAQYVEGMANTAQDSGAEFDVYRGMAEQVDLMTRGENSWRILDSSKQLKSRIASGLGALVGERRQLELAGQRQAAQMQAQEDFRQAQVAEQSAKERQSLVGHYNAIMGDKISGYKAAAKDNQVLQDVYDGWGQNPVKVDIGAITGEAIETSGSLVGDVDRLSDDTQRGRAVYVADPRILTDLRSHGHAIEGNKAAIDQLMRNRVGEMVGGDPSKYLAWRNRYLLPSIEEPEFPEIKQEINSVADEQTKAVLLRNVRDSSLPSYVRHAFDPRVYRGQGDHDSVMAGIVGEDPSVQEDRHGRRRDTSNAIQLAGKTMELSLRTAQGKFFGKAETEAGAAEAMANVITANEFSGTDGLDQIAGTAEAESLNWYFNEHPADARQMIKGIASSDGSMSMLVGAARAMHANHLGGRIRQSILMGRYGEDQRVFQGARAMMRNLKNTDALRSAIERAGDDEQSQLGGVFQALETYSPNEGDFATVTRSLSSYVNGLKAVEAHYKGEGGKAAGLMIEQATDIKRTMELAEKIFRRMIKESNDAGKLGQASYISRQLQRIKTPSATSRELDDRSLELILLDEGVR